MAESVSDKIRLLRSEGYPQKQAVAIALSMRDGGKMKLPSRGNKTYAQWVASMTPSQLAHYRAKKKDAQERYNKKRGKGSSRRAASSAPKAKPSRRSPRYASAPKRVALPSRGKKSYKAWIDSMSAPQLAWYRYQKSSASAAYQARKSGRIQGPMRKPKVSMRDGGKMKLPSRGNKTYAQWVASMTPSQLAHYRAKKKDAQERYNKKRGKGSSRRAASSAPKAKPSRRSPRYASAPKRVALPSRGKKSYKAWIDSMSAPQLAWYRYQKSSASAAYQARKSGSHPGSDAQAEGERETEVR